MKVEGNTSSPTPEPSQSQGQQSQQVGQGSDNQQNKVTDQKGSKNFDALIQEGTEGSHAGSQTALEGKAVKTVNRFLGEGSQNSGKESGEANQLRTLSPKSFRSVLDNELSKNQNQSSKPGEDANLASQGQGMPLHTFVEPPSAK